MKLYNHEGVWQLPGQQDKKAVKVEVPTGSADLCEFLNDRNVPPFPVFEAESVASAEPKERTDFMPPPPISQPTVEQITAKVSQFKTDEIVEFILDKASITQVERVFAVIGTRFAELIKGI